MILKNMQEKFIRSKPLKNIILRGKSNSGKREALLHRILFLINNFAFDVNDKIIFIEKDEKEKNKIEKRYLEIKNKNEYRYNSLLNIGIEPEFVTLNELVNKNLGDRKIINEERKHEIINKLIFNKKDEKYKKISGKNAYIILCEIKYMKNNKIYSFEDYLNLKGTPLKLRKNSLAKKEMFLLFNEYNNELNELNLVDEEDLLKISISNLENGNNKYVHVFINSAGVFSKLELEYLMMLCREKEYGTLTLSIDTDKGENVNSVLVKKGRIYYKKCSLNHKKVFNFNGILDSKNIANLSFVDKNKFIENYVFRDLKHRKEFKFSLESNGDKQKIIGEDYTKYNKEDLQEVPVFNNIAAGEPILINPEIEDIFNLPKYWIKGANKKFILKVKGDSMIDANIYNGDLVVIEQNPSPINGDIVAVNLEGNATLKKLKIEKDKILLMPENKNYKPIIVSKYDEFSILGKAVGIISKEGDVV